MTRAKETNNSPTPQDLLKAGLAYFEGGLNLIPVNAKKSPADPPLPHQKWKKYQTEGVTKAILRIWVNTPGVCGWAIVCGEISGGLTIMDFDEPGFYERWQAKVGELALRLPTQQTGSGYGYQVAFRSNLHIRNDKLACVQADNEEGRLTAIETRGEGGYAVVAPSFCPEATKRGKKHRQPYKVIQGDLAQIPSIPEEQAQFLLDVARSLDEMPFSKKKMEAAPLPPTRNGDGADAGIIGAFNETYDIGAILGRHGYEKRGTRFLAPDSTTGIPGVHIFENGRCYSHHANDPLNDGHSHDAFDVFRILEHAGDIRTAVKAAAQAFEIENPKPPPKDPQDIDGGQKSAHNFKLISVSNILSEPEEEAEWVWEGVLPRGGMSIQVAKPKVGKTTTALGLAVASSRGEDFLGRSTAQAPVVYLALEEKKGEVKKRLASLCVTDEPLHFHFGLAPKNAIREIDALAVETGAGLIIVDTLQKLTRIKDLNDYALVTNTLEPLLAISRERNCHIMLLHHAGKTERTDGDEILGSTALLGAVDTAIILKKREQGRTFSTIQRYGENIPETVLILHPDFSLTTEGTLDEARKRQIWGQIRELLEARAGFNEAEILEQVNCRKIDISAALRWALNQTPPLVQRKGMGKKGDPFKYFLPPLPPIYIREGEKQNLKNDITTQNLTDYSHSQELLLRPILGGRISPACLAAWDEAISQVVGEAVKKTFCN
jgi:hypothetical protein